MADALKLDVTIDSIEADLALLRLQKAFRDAGDTASEAAEKVAKFEKSYKDGAARQQAKKELDALRESTAKAGEANTTASGQVKAHDAALSGLTRTMLQYAAPAAVGAAALGTLRWADSIAEMAQRTSLTTTQVQQLSKMADKNGSSFGQMAALIQASEAKLTSHNKKAEEAVKLMGMAPAALLKLDPLERLRAIAKGLSDIEDPAQRSAAEVAILGMKTDAAAPALRALADGADKTETALGATFVRTMADANDQFDSMTNSIMDLARAFVGLPIVIGTAVGQMGKDSALGQWFAAMGLHDLGLPGQSGSGMGMPGLPKSPGGGFGMPTAAGAIDPLGGNSQGFIERVLGIKKTRGGSTSAPVIPYTANQWATIQQVLSGGNPLGMGGLGSFPGWAQGPLTSSMSAGALGLSMAGSNRMVGFAPTVAMNPAGGGPSWMSQHGAQLGLMAGGYAAQFLPGRAGQVAQGAFGMAAQGASMGAMFGPHGAAIGAGIGAVVGGVSSLFGGNKAAKNAKNAEISQVFEQFSTKDFQQLQNQAEKFGISMDKALSAKTMKDFGAAVDEVNTKLTEMNSIQSEIDMLTEQTTVGFDKMSAVASEFGLDIGKLGPAFQQASADKEIQKIVDALAIMEKGGADMNGVLDGMQDEISGVVQDSLQFGTTIPENMRPWIAKLAESGRLVGENGEKITDIKNLNFGGAMESQMDKLVRKLDELISKLAGVKQGFDDTKGSAEGLAGVDYTSGGGNTDGGDTTNASAGGLIGPNGKLLYFGRGGFVPRGTDTVPAMLTPGEMVISRDMVKGIAKNGRSGGAGVNVTVNVAGYLDSPQAQRSLASLVTDQIRREQSMRRTG